MKLKDLMNDNVKTITEDTPAEEAWHRMNLEELHHLVVVRGRDIVGIISERDLGGPHGLKVCEGQIVAELMTEDMITASPQTTLVEAARLLRGHRIGCLPVIDDDGQLAGIVTLSDMLEVLARGAVETTA